MKNVGLKQLFVRVIAIAIALVMCITLGACGSKDTSSEIALGEEDGEYEALDGMDDDGSGTDADGTVSGSKSGTTSKSTATGKGGSTTTANTDWIKDIPKKLQGTTVNFAVWGDENATEYAKVVKLFTKKTKINVKWVTYNEEKYVSTIVEQNAAGKGPDIVINNVTFPTSVEAVQELPAIFNLDDGFWDKRVTDALSVKGKKFFVNSYNSPFLTGGLFCFYNKQLFSNNNITSPQDYIDQGNWTMETLEKCMRDAYAKGFDGGTIQPHNLWTVTGAELINYNPSTGVFTSGLNDASQRADMIYALKFTTTLRKEGVISNNPLTRFAAGNMAIALVSNYAMKYNGWFKGMTPSSLGVVEMPATYNGKAANYYGAAERAYGIGRDAKNIEGAYYLLRFYLDINNYEDANADIFLNKNIERFYKETYLPAYKTKKLSLWYTSNPLSLVGSPWTNASAGTWADLYSADAVPEEIETNLMARANIVENAAKKATEKLGSIVK